MTVFAKTKCTISKALDIVGQHKFSEQWTGKEIDADPGDDPDAYARLKAARDELRIGALYHSEVATWIMQRGGKQEVFLPVAWGPGGNVWAGCLVDRRWREKFRVGLDEFVSSTYRLLMRTDRRSQKIALAMLERDMEQRREVVSLRPMLRHIAERKEASDNGAGTSAHKEYPVTRPARHRSATIYVDRAALEAKLAENDSAGSQVGKRKAGTGRYPGDEALVDVMHGLITSGKVSTRYAAASKLVARVEGSADDESKKRRLCRQYDRKYSLKRR